MSAIVKPLDDRAPLEVTTAILERSSGVSPETSLVCVGDAVHVDEQGGYLRGHGTMMQNEGDEQQLVATVCGCIQRLNKLVMVQPFTGRYDAQLGDIVVGRVLEVQMRRWVVDISSVTQASLQLSAVDLPGGIQRRRTTDDELMMRDVYCEGDVIAAEVQMLSKRDKSINLHMRGSKYRKLRHGQLVQVPALSIRRRSSHFVNIAEKGVQIIIGCNGWIWIGPLDPASVRKPAAGGVPRRFGGGLDPAEDDNAASYVPTSEQWQMSARFAQAARCLARLGLPIHRESLEALVEESLRGEVACSRMLDMEFMMVAVGLEEARREKNGTADHAMQVD